MKKLRTFKCSECDTEQDRLAEDGTETLECIECQSPAHLQLSMPKYFGNAAGTRSPSAVN